MKLYLNNILNVVLAVIVGYVVFQKVIVWRKGTKQIGQIISQVSLPILLPEGKTDYKFPVGDSGKKVLVFWATWCGPCTVELGRIQSLVTKKEISPEQVIAISISEEEDLLRKTITERGYTFPVASDRHGHFSNQFQISGTPTTILINDYRVQEVSVGLSVLLERNLKKFLTE